MPRMTEQHTDSGLAALMDTLGRQARAAAAHMARASAASKSRALRALARLLRENAAALQEANARDLARASELSSRPPSSKRPRKAASSWRPCPT